MGQPTKRRCLAEGHGTDCKRYPMTLNGIGAGFSCKNYSNLHSNRKDPTDAMLRAHEEKTAKAEYQHS